MTKPFASVTLAAMAALLLVLAGAQNRRLMSGRAPEEVPIENAPATVTFVTVVLGGFRGIVADILWLRASRLQEEGRYFELTQLADWITQMEPHAVQVWAFHAWNMAYNVSVMMADPEDRWRWVQNGIRLLRDRAIRANPSSADLHAELAWLYHHKIASEYDPSHPTYKRRFAAGVEDILPDGRLSGDLSSEQVTALQEEHGLRIEQARAVDVAYGPLDWRGAGAHAVYWAVGGRQRAGGDRRALLRCERALYQAMARMFFSGQFGGDDAPDADLALPRPDLLPRVVASFEAALSAHPDDDGILNAYLSFLSSAVLLLHAQGDVDQARDLYAAIGERAPETSRTMLDFDTFVSSGVGLADMPPYVLDAVYRLRGASQ